MSTVNKKSRQTDESSTRSSIQMRLEKEIVDMMSKMEPQRVIVKDDFSDTDLEAYCELCSKGLFLSFHPDDENGQVWEGKYYSKVALALLDVVLGSLQNKTIDRIPTALIEVFKKYYAPEFNHLLTITKITL